MVLQELLLRVLTARPTLPSGKALATCCYQLHVAGILWDTSQEKIWWWLNLGDVWIITADIQFFLLLLICCHICEKTAKPVLMNCTFNNMYCHEEEPFGGRLGHSWCLMVKNLLKLCVCPIKLKCWSTWKCQVIDQEFQWAFDELIAGIKYDLSLNCSAD